MFDAPVDSWYTWLGLATVAAITLGTATALPTTPPPDASSVAATVDSVAAAAPPATARYRVVDADLRLTTRGVSVRSASGSAYAGFVATTIVPAGDDDRLAAVARGASPQSVFSDERTFAGAVTDARSTGDASNTPWTAAGTLVARHVSWGDTDVTLLVVS